MFSYEKRQRQARHLPAEQLHRPESEGEEFDRFLSRDFPVNTIHPTRVYLLSNSQAIYKEPHEFQQEISSFDEPVYFTTLVTSFVNHRVALFKLDWHLERLFSSALHAHAPVLHAHALVLRTLRQYYQEYTERGNHQLRLRLMIARDKLYFSIEPYQPVWPLGSPIVAVTYQGLRKNPPQKILHDKTSLQAREYAVSKGTQEAFFVDENGYLREGAWSNVFWVDQEQRLWTPQTQILPGITRRAILEHCPLAPVTQDILWKDLLSSAEEIFITQSTSGITPVIACDGQTIGQGSIGPITLQVMSWYQHYLEATAEPILQTEENEIKA